MVQEIFKDLGFDNYRAQLSLRDPTDQEKYIGDPKAWQRAEQDIREAAQEAGLTTEEVQGEAAFYGPKLDFMLSDALGRSWQLGTIQVDYQLPARFELVYIGMDNQPHRPVMIHRAPFGSMERFVALLIEHCKGDFPLWLAPTQVRVLCISEQVIPYATQVQTELEKEGIRVDIDDRNEKIGRKIRDTELQKVPLMLLLGAKEAEAQTLSLRVRKSVDPRGDLGEYTLDKFFKEFSKRLTLPSGQA